MMYKHSIFVICAVFVDCDILRFFGIYNSRYNHIQNQTLQKLAEDGKMNSQVCCS